MMGKQKLYENLPNWLQIETEGRTYLVRVAKHGRTGEIDTKTMFKFGVPYSWYLCTDGSVRFDKQEVLHPFQVRQMVFCVNEGLRIQGYVSNKDIKSLGIIL